MSLTAMAASQKHRHEPKLLPQSQAPKVVALPEALSLALSHHAELKLAQNALEQQKTEQWMNIGRLLPKLSLGSSYTRNIPKKELSLFDAKQAATLNRHVAGLLRKASDTTAADQLEQQADFMMRRDADRTFITNPKDVLDAKLGLTIPLFQGDAVAQILASQHKTRAIDAHLQAQRSNTLYETAQAYFLGLYHVQVMTILQQAHTRAEQALKRVSLRDANYVVLEAFSAERKAAYQEAVLDYRARVGALGLMLGSLEEFTLTTPSEEIFSALPTDAEQLSSLAFLQRDDVKAYDYDLSALDYDRMGQYLSFLPTLWVGADAHYTSNDKTLVGEKLTYALSLNANLSIFDGGLSIQALRRAGLKRSELLIKRDTARAELYASIRGSLEKLAVLRLKHQASRKKQAVYEQSGFNNAVNLKSGIETFIAREQERITTALSTQHYQAEIYDEQLLLMKESGLIGRLASP